MFRQRFLQFVIVVISLRAAVPFEVAHAATVQRSVDTVRISDRVTCPRCSVEFTRIATITTTLADSVLALGHTLARNSKSLFYSASRDRVAVYSSEGRFLRAFGQAGDGPGELRNIHRVKVGLGDSVWVLHGAGGWSLFAPDDSFVRSGRFAGSVLALLALPSGRLLLPGPVRADDRAAGFPLHLLSSDMTLLKSFGAEKPILDPRCWDCVRRHVAVTSTPDVLWAAWTNRLQLERWSITGGLERVIMISAPWFPPRTADPPTEGRYLVLPPRPAGSVLTDQEIFELSKNLTTDAATLGLTIDANGLLFLSVHGWPEGVKKSNTIEVVDPQSGQLLARLRWPDNMQGHLLPGGLTWAVREDADGLKIIDVLKIEVRRPGF